MKSIFKYVSKLDYAYSLLSGKVFHQTLGYFRDYEDLEEKQVIGDEYESTCIFRPDSGLQVNNLTNGTTDRLDRAFESSVRAGEIYVFCISLVLSDALKAEFRAVACIEITNPRVFIKRWQNALPLNAKYFTRRIRYYERSEVLGNVWQQPRRIATSKLKRFAYQQEYRLGFSTTEALNFGECTFQLEARRARPKRKLDEHDHLVLDLGDLSDICRLHML